MSVFLINKDENVHRFALTEIRGKLLERARERERERKSEKEIEKEKEIGNVLE